jgi:hypothetical protein
MRKQLPSVALILAPLIAQASSVEFTEMESYWERLAYLEKQTQEECFINPSPAKGIDLYTKADLLVWKIHEELPIAVLTKNPPFGTLTGPVVSDDLNYSQLVKHGQVENLNFHWDAGSRAGIGYHTPHEKLDLSLTWLRFFTKSSRSLHAKHGHQLQSTQLDPLVVSSNQINDTDPETPYNSFGHIKGSWYAHLNQLDLDLARSFCVGSWFGVRPHLGLRATWLRQRLSVQYLDNLGFAVCCSNPNGHDFSLHKKCTWWGIGPEAGVDLHCVLGKGFTVFGNAAGSIEYGLHKTKDKELDINLQNSGVDPLYVEVSDSYRMSHPIFDLQLGLRWEYLFGDRLHFSLDLAWEHHIYYSLNRFPYFVSDFAVGNFRDQDGDKTYEGWTLSAGFDF